MIKFGLVSRIALLVIAIEVAAFGILGGFYIDRYSRAVDAQVRSRLHMVGQMIGSEELAVSTMSRQSLISDLVGAPCLTGIAIGGNDRVIVATDPAYLGQLTKSIPDLETRWFDPSAPAEQFIEGANTLTSVMRIKGSKSDTLLYTTIITINTAELDAQKRTVVLWGIIGSILFVVLSSAALLFVAQRFFARRVDASLAVLKSVEK